MDRIYVAIDLKSFYASVECVERKLDPLQTNLVVADPTRTEKTICLAVSPSLKKYGIPGRARLFEVVQKVEQINNDRRYKAPGRRLTGKSIWSFELERFPELEVDYVVAPPQMAHYMKVSSQIYGIYLKYVAPEDIFAYSIDEVFIDATSYLDIYHLNAHDFTRMLIKDVLHTTGITATAGIGPNMFLCKVAMDIVAKHIPADRDGVRIAEIDEQKYKELLWEHTPLTDFWRVGRGTASRIAKIGLYTMGDIARCSLNRQSLGQLYKLLGKNTELLVDHAWGIEPTTIKDVKAYEPDNNSKGIVTNQIVLTIGYDRESLASGKYMGEVVMDYYGREVPKHAHGTINLGRHTSSTKLITEAVMKLFDAIADPDLLSRRLGIAACNVISEEDVPKLEKHEQISIFDLGKEEEETTEQDEKLAKERALQEAMLEIKHKYGKNAVVKAKNLSKGGTAIERNGQIGGHKA